MRISGRPLTLLVVCVALTFAFSLVVWSGSANQGGTPQEANKQEMTPQDDVPVLDLKQAEKNESDQLKGRKRGQSLRQHRRIEELPVGAEPLPANVHFWHLMPALPVEQSNAIVLGKITDRRAFLVEDRFGIYSDFSIKISEIFKDDLGGLYTDQTITASRPGGAIRFPSGKIQKYTISSMGFPQQDKVYVLFLKRDEAGDYSIRTGYEVTGNVVEPLDGRRNLPKNQRYNQFDTFRGASLETFRDALQKAIQQAEGGRP
jgi:hypothetical protein